MNYAQHRADKAKQLVECFSNVDEIRKGDISEKLASGWGSTKPLTFVKTGKEIKEKLPTIESVLINQKAILLAEMAALKTAIGSDPSESYSEKKWTMSRYPYDMCSGAYDPMNRCYLDATDQNKSCSKYNELCWQLLDIERDLEAITVMAANLDDSKKYDLNVSQLVALQFNS